jgi:hypothetical protein
MPGLLEPVAQAGWLVGRKRAKHLIELRDQTTRRPPSTTRVPARIDKNQAAVGLTALVCMIGKWDEVSDVLGYDRPMLPLSRCEHSRVRQRAQLAALRHRDDIVAARTKLLGDRWRIHLIEQEPQPSASRARSQAAR